MKLTKARGIKAASRISIGLALAVASSLYGQVTPGIFAKAQSVTAANPNTVMQATVWLKMHDQKQFDQTVAGLYKESSTTYHHWLKPEDLARFAPTDADVQTLKRQLTAQGLDVTQTGANNMFVKVSGNVAAMQTAFHTEIKSLVVQGKSLRAATVEPKMIGISASLVSGVTGLTHGTFKSHAIHPFDPDTHKRFSAVPANVSPNGVLYASDCFRPKENELFKVPGTTLPIGAYVGQRYGTDITNTKPGTVAPCGYKPSNLTAAYGLQAAYKQGLNGAGQTIVIVDAFGSSTIKADANAFSKLNGLPTLADSNFQVIYPSGAPTATSVDNAAGWAEETSLDVEWAHALAPGAKIALVVAASDSDGDIFDAAFYAVQNQLGSVISNSYGGFEAVDIVENPLDLILSNLIAEIAAAQGISINYSSGDDGDSEAVVGIPTVSDLGASPYATSVGGTTLALTAGNKIKFQTGWGSNITKLATAARAPLTPPVNEGFLGGAGGGESLFYDKPDWQSGLPGVGRQQPDVSLVADPYTGVEFVYTLNGVQYLDVVGGTSLACPAFSAIWAIANQRAVQLHGDGALLGQAAPIIAGLSGSNALTDVTAQSSADNVVGVTATRTGLKFYSADLLAEPLEGTHQYLSDFYNSPISGSWYVLTFGTDTSLTTTPGWDNVTGFGTPNGLSFINAAAR